MTGHAWLVLPCRRLAGEDLGPGAIFDQAMRTWESKEHVTIQADTPCRLAVLPRDQLDGHALVGVAAEQAARLRAHGSKRQKEEPD